MATTLSLGKTIENGTIRVHRFADHFRVWDLENAGKRGRQVRTMVLASAKGGQSAAEDFCEYHAGSVALCRSYEEVKGMFPDARIDESAERGVDVLPKGTETISFTTRTGLVVKADPHDFDVLHRWELTRKDGTRTGEYQDTHYSPDGRKDAKKFYTWLQKNSFHFNNMSLQEVRDNFRQLGVKYDYH